MIQRWCMLSYTIYISSTFSSAQYKGEHICTLKSGHSGHWASLLVDWYQGSDKNKQKNMIRLTCSFTSPFQEKSLNWWFGGCWWFGFRWDPLIFERDCYLGGTPDPTPKQPIYHLLNHGLRWSSNQSSNSIMAIGRSSMECSNATTGP